MARILRRARVETTAGETFIFTRYDDGRLEWERTHSKPNGPKLPDDEGEVKRGGYDGRVAGLNREDLHPVVAYLHRPDAVMQPLYIYDGERNIRLGESAKITMLIGEPVQSGQGYF